jgi:hypothetical protein
LDRLKKSLLQGSRLPNPRFQRIFISKKPMLKAFVLSLLLPSLLYLEVDQAPVEVIPIPAPLHFGHWTLDDAVPEFKPHLDAQGVTDYMFHINLMEEHGYIDFLTDSTFIGHNGLLEMNGSYRITRDSLFTRNRHGFPHDYRILALDSTQFVISSEQKDLILTLHYARR